MTPCWEYKGYLTRNRYGQRYRKRFSSQLTHRQVMEMRHGSDSIRGKVVMHTCDNPPCFRPSHLRVGTQAENNADAKAKGRATGNKWSKLTHCKHGHEFTEDNTYVRPDGSGRACKTCRQAASRRSHHARLGDGA